MRWFWKRRRPDARPARSDRKAMQRELADWVGERRGVEVYVEPRTAVTETSMVLVAHDGEFTRRRIESTDAARDFAREHALPIYDATVVGYPQRMRDYSRRQTLLRERKQRQALGDE